MTDKDLIAYKSVFYTTAATGPETVVYDSRTLFRYMDKIYIPNPPSRLQPNEVSDLSELRLLLRDAIVENQYTQAVLDHLYRLATAEKGGMQLLDLGCGDGNIASLILSKPRAARPLETVGIDLCERAATVARKRLENNNDPKLGTALAINRNQRVPLRSDYFHAAVANFVLHFPIYQREAVEIFRVLAPGGRLAYNDYRHESDPGHTTAVIEMLNRIGFVTEMHIQPFLQQSGVTNRSRNHAIVLCTKSCMD